MNNKCTYCDFQKPELRMLGVFRVPSVFTFGIDGTAISVCHKKRQAYLVLIADIFAMSFTTVLTIYRQRFETSTYLNASEN